MNKPAQKKYECQVCGEVFAYFANKIKHETQCVGKDGEKQSKFRNCPQCFVQYANESSLKRHLWNCTHRHEEAVSKHKESDDFDKLYYGNNLKKKWKFCFFDNCYCTFYHISHLIKHIYSCHDDTLKYGIQMLEFSSMHEFERWKMLESLRTNSSFSVRTNVHKYISYVCQHDDAKRSDLATRKTEKKWFKGVVKKGRLCMSRILVIRNENKIICTYMNVHTHDLNQDDLKIQRFDKEFYNKIKSYICMGVDVNEIYNELIVKNKDEAQMMYFKEHFRYAKKNIGRITRELRLKLQRGDISNFCIDKSDEESCVADNFDDSINQLMDIDRDEGQEVEEELQEITCSTSKSENEADEETSVLTSVGLTSAQTSPETVIEATSEQLSKPKRVVLLKKLGNNGITLLPISKAKNLANEEVGVRLTPIEISEKTVPSVKIDDTNMKLDSLEDDQFEKETNPEELVVVKTENSFTPMNIVKERKASSIKKQVAIIDKYIDDCYLDSDLDYLGNLVDVLAKKCKSTSAINDLLNDETQILKDSSSIILKYLKYTNDLQENVLFLNNNKIIISMVDLLTLVSPASSKPITYLCKRADPTFQEGRLTETIVDAFCYRLSQTNENKMYIFGNTNLAYQLLNSEDGDQFFAQINYKNKTHLFLPVHCNGVWTLIVFNLEHGLYGHLNSVRVNNAEHDTNIKKIIDRLKIILPNETWKQMTFLSVYPKNAERSGVFICFYLECLTKKLPLMTPMKVHRFRLSVFNCIRGNCLREPKIDPTNCVVCKSIIMPLSIRVRCKECLVSYHYTCIQSGNVNDFVCNDLKEIV